MKTIQYTYSTKGTIIFDNDLHYTFHSCKSIDAMVNQAEWFIDLYGFSKAEGIDSETGELLFTICDDD